MEYTTEQFQDILLDDIKVHPELITDVLFDEYDVSVILEKRGNVVRFAYIRAYENDTRRILKEARLEYAEKKRAGYNRGHAFNDLCEAQEEIQQHLKTP